MQLFRCRQPESRCGLRRSETSAAGTVALGGDGWEWLARNPTDDSSEQEAMEVPDT